MTTIADRIDTAMKLAGFKSQAELARASGVPESTIARILKGGTLPSVENIAAIAAACKRSIDWIVNGVDNPEITAPEVSLVYATLEELKLLTQFREANELGKFAIKSAANHAPKKSPIDSADET